jgi:hypothetical protein
MAACKLQVPGVDVRHGDGAHATSHSGSNAGRGIFEDHTVGRRHPEALGGE